MRTPFDRSSRRGSTQQRQSCCRLTLERLEVVAIKKPSGKMMFNPSPETRLEAGDTQIMLGGRRGLDHVAALADG